MAKLRNDLHPELREQMETIQDEMFGQVPISERFVRVDNGSSAFLIDKKTGKRLEVGLFALKEVVEALNYFVG